MKFAHLAEKSVKGSMSNLSTKGPTPGVGDGFADREALAVGVAGWIPDFRLAGNPVGRGGAGVAGRGRRGARRVLVHGVVGGGGVEPLVEERRALHRDEENRAEEVHRDFEVGPLLRISTVVDLSILAVL